ncbi:hypothetical protein GA0070624_1702 [Micromonospora rhizosphaerae]|uniref:Uncharacterized protein n=1 Tax=Micromonospora rhizosphaerae TaxID=568872 RepID=A0A1C6RPQ8_9ACTN|nr:hypothetical protein [Micromonospora rhizosphaerae]SCL19193.1 hypothetical protein GA0070624_1702 [Micromonospora rhizosphaerae]
MSNSRAYPVLRTPDVGRALHAVGHLLSVADLRDTEVQLWARTGRHSGLPRYLDAYGHWLRADGDDRMFVDVACEKETGPQDPADPLVDVEVLVCGLGLVEGRLAETVGPDQARLDWWHYAWPAVPCRDLGRQAKHAYVQLVLNATDIWATEPADGHTVFVHVGAGERERAEWLAAVAGGALLGPEQFGW